MKTAFFFLAITGNSFKFTNHNHQQLRSETCCATKTEFPDLEKCLQREYATFFNPMETKFYDINVEFIDPLTKISGISSYMKNVNMLSGKTFLGKFLFEDASISLHNIVQLEKEKLQTRWTLQLTVKLFPWKPRARFTGVSVYTLNERGIVIKQEDFWDSINLYRGLYTHKPLADGLADLLTQMRQENSAEMAAPELPYELLRRSPRYEVRRYPATVCAQTPYDQRPQGYDRLGSYASGSNERSTKVPYYSPTLMQVSENTSTSSGAAVREKVMSWPLLFAPPGSELSPLSALPAATIPSVVLAERPAVVVAVCRFTAAATEPVVRGYTNQLRQEIMADALVPTPAVDQGTVIVAQYDALFSLNKRRNEVWIELLKHPWQD